MVTTISPLPKELEKKLIKNWKEYSMPKVIFEFDYHEDKEELEIIRRAADMQSALFDIYNSVRTELKHGDEELSTHIDNLLEQIKDISSEFT